MEFASNFERYLTSCMPSCTTLSSVRRFCTKSLFILCSNVGDDFKTQAMCTQLVRCIRAFDMIKFFGSNVSILLLTGIKNSTANNYSENDLDRISSAGNTANGDFTACLKIKQPVVVFVPNICNSKIFDH